MLGDRSLVPFADRVDQRRTRREVVSDRRPVVLPGGGDYLAVRDPEPAGGEELLGGSQQAQPSFRGPPGTSAVRRPRTS